MPAKTTPIFENEFGTVYADRVAFNAKKGWFGGGVLEELPIRHITSVRLETTRRILLGIVLIAVGAFAFFSGKFEVTAGGVVVAGLGILSLMGYPTVSINTAGTDRVTSSGGFWQKGAAEEFVAAVRKALFANE